MKLYEALHLTRRVHIFMAEKGLECDRVAVDIRAAENLSADYLAKTLAVGCPCCNWMTALVLASR